MMRSIGRKVGADGSWLVIRAVGSGGICMSTTESILWEHVAGWALKRGAFCFWKRGSSLNLQPGAR